MPAIAVAAPCHPMPAWVGLLLEELCVARPGHASDSVYLLLDGPGNLAETAGPRDSLGPIGQVLADVYRRLARRAMLEPDAEAPVSPVMEQRINERWTRVDAPMRRVAGALEPSTRAALEQANISVLVWLHASPPPADLASLTERGVLWIEWPVASAIAREWPGSVDVLQRRTTSTVIVKHQAGVSSPVVDVFRHDLPVHDWNARITANIARWVAVVALSRVVRHKDWSGLSPATTGWAKKPVEEEAQIQNVELQASSKGAALALARYALTQLRERTGGSQWRIAAYWHGADDPSVSPCLDLSRYRTLATPRGEFWADPFVAQHEGTHWIFYEQKPRWSGKGIIKVVEYGPAGVLSPPTVVLDRPYHLAYPYVFYDDGQWFMVPETSEAHRIELYRATAFPFEWELDQVLIDGVEAVDATLHRDADRWWMFVTLVQHGVPAWDELHLYSSTTLRGTWTPHSANPLKRTGDGSRPAGALWRNEQGKLVRPGQVCAPRYGAAVQLHTITEMSDVAFGETPTTLLSPPTRSNFDGLHTIHRAGRLSVIDWRRRFGGR